MGFLNNSLQIILVLYKTKIDDSLCYQSLLRCIYELKIDFELLIYNNSPEIVIPQKENCVVINAKQNDMLAGAYNYALHKATTLKKKWLLLLDQDTELTSEYFKELSNILNSNISERVSAIVPQIQKGKRFIVPKTYFYKMGPSFFLKSVKDTGIYSKCLISINSGTILNIETMIELDGFSYKYPLDGLDSWYFSQLYKRHKSIYVMNSVIEQNLSLLDYSTMTNFRYKSILKGELQFCRDLGHLAVFFWKLKIPYKIMRMIFSKNRRSYIPSTLLYIFK